MLNLRVRVSNGFIITFENAVYLFTVFNSAANCLENAIRLENDDIALSPIATVGFTATAENGRQNKS